jgi:hypothetical protein
MTERFLVTVGDEDTFHSEHEDAERAIKVAFEIVGGNARPAFVPEGQRWHAQEVLTAVYSDGFLCLVGDDETACIEQVSD